MSGPESPIRVNVWRTSLARNQLVTLPEPGHGIGDSSLSRGTRAALRALHCTQEFNLSGLLRAQCFETMRAREQARPASTAGAPEETPKETGCRSSRPTVSRASARHC